MAVAMVGSTGFKYQGLSTDTKPTTAPDGATFYELDTGRTYVFHVDAWVEKVYPA
jgi:hypothetical protein